MARTWAELRRLQVPELIAEYDKLTPHVQEGLNFFRDEIFQREVAAQGDRMEAMTRMIKKLTWVITGLTLVSTVAVLWEVFHK
jgi:hypothetical protein